MTTVTLLPPVIAKFLSFTLTMSFCSMDHECIHPLWCDGAPPKLINRDKREYTYNIECGRKSVSARIPAGATQSLEGKPGCLLVFGDKSVTLYVDLVCVIARGRLGCDLS
jgi:hypothetical protein